MQIHPLLMVMTSHFKGIQTASHVDPSFGAIPVIAHCVGVSSRSSGTFRRSVATLVGITLLLNVSLRF